MRFVDRGPEPNGVAGYAQQFTQGWVDYVQSDGVGGRPTDSYWREFRGDMGIRTKHICWYCERRCDFVGDLVPTLDHFRPISRFPELVYEWANWIFSCSRCNDIKRNRWPRSGYVDPCATDVLEHPERYFDYFAGTGEILTREGLSDTARKKALDTIDALDLNNIVFMMPLRREATKKFRDELLKTPASEREAFIARHVEGVEYAGVIRIHVEQLRRSGKI